MQTHLEKAVLAGSGSSGQPLGLINTPGKQTSSLSATPTNPQMLDMVAKYANANGNMATARFVMHPSDATLLMRSFISANGGEVVLNYQNGEYRVAGIPVLMTTNMTQGKILLFEPQRVEVVYFGPAMLLIDPFSNGKSVTGQTEVHVINFIDLGVSDPSLIVVGEI